MDIFPAEVIGTALLILFGDGVVAAVLLSQSKAQNSGWIVITFGWGMAVAMAVYAVGQFTGAHLNPAVTLGFAANGTIDWGDVPAYIGGEFVGAFIGATLVFLSYSNHWRATEDPGLKLAVFSTGPAIRSYAWNLVTEVIGTFVLIFAILVSGGTPTQVGPLYVALIVLGIGNSLGGPTGYAINPARDLGPRIAHAVLPIKGKGSSDWGYSWVPVVGPIIGAIIATLLFQATGAQDLIDAVKAAASQ